MRNLIHLIAAAGLLWLGPKAGAQPYTFTTLAGYCSRGFVDGNGSAARFSGPIGIVMDNSSNIVVADQQNGCLRLVTPGGVVTTLGSSSGNSGGAPGPNLIQFDFLAGVAVDGFSNLYVLESYFCDIKKVTPAGVVTTLTGFSGAHGSTDGPLDVASFNNPDGIAVDSLGNVYVADTDNSTIRKVSVAGDVTTLAGLAGTSAYADGTDKVARFNYPKGVAVDAAGNVYVADSGNHCIRIITPDGLVSTLAGSPFNSGNGDGTGAAAQFLSPYSVTADFSGIVYVADSQANTIRAITPGGVVTTLAGNGGSLGSVDGTGRSARFDGPHAVAIGPSGNVYVGDTGNNTIRTVTAGGVVSTIAGVGASIGSTDGRGSAARFWLPGANAVDASGNSYVADTANNTIRKVNSDGLVTTVAGQAGSAGSANGTTSFARFNNPNGIVVDASGNIYVGDTGNSAVRKIATNGIVTTLARNLSYPQGVAADSALNVYVTDSGDNTIRKISPAGVVSLFAGQAGVTGSADGPGSTARFNWPSGIAVDRTGNVFVADCVNSTIRKITSGGVVTTVAGLAGQSGHSDGLGSAARFFYPNYVAVDAVGNLYVADSNACRIRKITPSGMVMTLAGSRYGGNDGTGSAATFASPYGIAVDYAGTVYVADTYNNAIRKGVPSVPSLQITVTAGVAGLTWPYFPLGYSLEFTSDLKVNNWTPVVTTQTIIDGQNFVGDIAAQPAGYYRLRHY